MKQNTHEIPKQTKALYPPPSYKNNTKYHTGTKMWVKIYI